MYSSFRSNVVVAAVLLFATTLYASVPQKGIPRQQDFGKPSNVYATQNAEIDARTGIPRALWNINAGPYSGTAVEIARQFLSENSGMFQMQRNLSDLISVRLQENFGISHVSFFQSVHTVPVFRSDVVVSINHQNVVTFVSNNYKPNLDVETNPSLFPEDAYLIAKEHLHIIGKIISEPKTELMIYAEDETPILSYRVSIFAEKPLGDWEVFVNATNGTIVSSRDNAIYEKSQHHSVQKKATGSGYIWNPDPLTSSGQYYGTPGYVDPSGNDADTPELNAQRKLVTLQDITFTGSVYKLEGPHCKLLDFESPTETFPMPAHPDSFQFLRSQQGFEDVMVYFWIDSSQRYIQSLGFDSIQNLPIECDPHGLSGADNSHYIPSTNRLAWGEGGSDDGEDLDVIWHEYGHAIHNGTRPGWGGNEAGHLGEGFGDYWAGSYSRAINDTFNISRDKVFTWDAGFTSSLSGTFWAGRTLIDTRPYPAGGVGGWQVHDAGQIWSSVLLLIWKDIGREVTDKLVLKSHYYLSTSPTMRQNAQAVIQADRDLYGGVHLQQIVNRFGSRNFVNPAEYIPQVNHTKLVDTEDLNGPYTIKAIVLPGVSPLAQSSLKVFYGRTTSFTDSVQLLPTGNQNEYAGDIPGNGISATYRYYIIVKDSSGASATSPANAPIQFHQFYVGFDTIRPSITHFPLRNQGIIRWPAKVSAQVTDNLGVDSVWVDYFVNTPATSGSFALVHQQGNQYAGVFDIDTSDIEVGDSIFYKVQAKDISLTGNISTSPATGFHTFVLIQTKGTVLVVDDDTTSSLSKKETEKGFNYVFENTSSSRSSNLFNTALTESGYLVDIKKIGEVVVTTFDDYDIVVTTSGINVDPMRRVEVRQALIARVQQGKKVWIEGGEVGYDFRYQTTELDKPFRQQVLHDSSWIADNSAGDVTFVIPSHPIFTTPHQISAPITFTARSTYADKDAMSVHPNDAGTVRISSWSAQPNYASIVVWNNSGNLNAGKIIFTMLAVGSITDSLVAKKLIENGIEFLLAPDTEPFSGLNETFEVASFPPAGWQSVVVTGDSGWRMTTISARSGNRAAFCEHQSPDTTISMGSKMLITKKVNLTGGSNTLKFWVRRAYPFAYPPDTLLVKLSTTDSLPSSFTTTVYKCYTGDTNSGNPNIYSTVYKQFKVSLGNYSGSAFLAFDHQDYDGQALYLDDVKLEVVDDIKEFGKIHPASFVLEQNYPNPFNPSTYISFSLPEQANVELKIFNILGQEITTLVNEVLESGNYRAEWNTTSAIPSGVYFYRMGATSTHGTKSFAQIKKMVVLK
ncbi:MAG: T9SS type A sorting domain-containing protein [Ignavibacteria bacterium]|nr:T9SS type A sorting domain-containing protein [Ignavibacteria bacterium]